MCPAMAPHSSMRPAGTDAPGELVMESDRLLRGATSEEEAATSPPCPESDASADLPRVTVIVPVYNGRATLGSCLAALEASRAGPAEVIVVDDASTDGSGSLAAAMGARVIRLEANSGPAAARNRGAAQATGDVLFFVDADVAVAPGAVDRVRSALHGRRDLAALFGSYDRD